MNKPLREEIKKILFKYIILVFNTAENSGIPFIIQIRNGEDYFYEITAGLEKIAMEKKAGFYTIDLDFEDFGMSEIDENGKKILPPWLKKKEHSIILVYNIDEISKKNYKMKQLKELISKSTIEGISIGPEKHFILLSSKDFKSKSNIIDIDIKKALEILKKEENND